LAFYGLIQGAQWEKCGFPLEASPGLLIAFRPSTLHEVRPITFGQRFTIAAWFTDESSPESSHAQQRSAKLNGRAQGRKQSRTAKNKLKTPTARERC
jgi:predicted 2-oxoglutarate/Fe(II)-dependent dioxygenase YbiX